MAADVGWSSWFLLTACNAAKTPWPSEDDHTQQRHHGLVKMIIHSRHHGLVRMTTQQTPWPSKDDYTADTMA